MACFNLTKSFKESRLVFAGAGDLAFETGTRSRRCVGTSFALCPGLFCTSQAKAQDSKGLGERQIDR